MNNAIHHFARAAIDGAEQRSAVSEEQRLLDEMRHAVAERLERRCFMRLRQIEVAQGRLREILDTELAGVAHSRKAGRADAALAEAWLTDAWHADTGLADVVGVDVEHADIERADIERADVERADVERADVEGALNTKPAAHASPPHEAGE
ncbi:MAG TPA: hypothetical protein VH105_21310 [Burkholderiales bacterium]|nr:hypothetical protein [Burkholderiales bacterium]